MQDSATSRSRAWRAADVIIIVSCRTWELNRPSYNSFTEEVVQDVELDGVPSPSVPSLFRQTPISTTKRREPMRSESPVQRHSRRSPDRYQ